MATPGHEGSPSHDGYDEHNVIFSTQTNSVNDNDCVTIKRKILSQKLFNEIYDAQRPPSQISVIKAFCKSKTKSYCMKNFYFQRCIRLFPFISVLYHYKWKVDITYDLIAGLTVGVMNIPQGLAYGMLASLLPVYGLYVSLFPSLIYFFFGSSRHISVGTFAVISLMVGAVVDRSNCNLKSSSLNTFNASTTLTTDLYSASILPQLTTLPNLNFDNSQEQIDFLQCKLGVATATTFLVGVYQMCMSVLGLGSLTIYMPEPVMRGFVTGAAVHVAISQLKYATGIPLYDYNGPLKIIKIIVDFFVKIKLTNVASLLTFVICTIVLIICKQFVNDRVRKKIKIPFPSELLVLVVATICSHFGQLKSKFALDIVGTIPFGLPPPKAPPLERFADVAMDAVPIAIVSFAISISLAKVFAKNEGHALDNSQELLAYGLCNFISSFFNCFVSAASLARSTVQHAVGGRTQVADLVSCGFLIVVIFGIGPLFYDLPKGVLAAVILVSLKGLFLQFKDLQELWKTSVLECLMWLVAFICTVVLDVDIGLLCGVLFAFVVIILRSQRPHCCLLGQAATTEIYRDTQSYHKVLEMSGIKIFRFDSPLHYLNADYFTEELLKKSEISFSSFTTAIKNIQPSQSQNGFLNKAMNNYVEPEVELPQQPTLHTIIVDCSMISYIDTVGLSALNRVGMIKDLKRVEVQLLLASCKGDFRNTLQKYEELSSYLKNNVFLTVHDAVLTIQLLTNATEVGNTASLKTELVVPAFTANNEKF